MSAAKHTPGPWFVGHYGIEALWVGPSVQSLFVCKVAWECDESRSNSRANACLIAAAPELYQALRDAVAALGGITSGNVPQTVRDALYKATGAAS